MIGVGARRKETGPRCVLVKLIKDGISLRETGHPAQLAETCDFCPRGRRQKEEKRDNCCSNEEDYSRPLLVDAREKSERDHVRRPDGRQVAGREERQRDAWHTADKWFFSHWIERRLYRNDRKYSTYLTWSNFFNIFFFIISKRRHCKERLLPPYLWLKIIKTFAHWYIFAMAKKRDNISRLSYKSIARSRT